jgi:hypothetical protein
MEMSPTIGNLAAALCAAQAEMRGVYKDGKNPHFKSRYATLENVIDTARPALNKHGIAWMQSPGALVDGAITVTTILMHKSGEWVSSSFQMPLAKRDPQATGSAVTYASRYALMAMLGLPPTDETPADDDGEVAHGRGVRQPSLQELKADVEKLGLDQPKKRVDPVAEDKIIETMMIALGNSVDRQDLENWYAHHKATIGDLSHEGQDRVRKAYARTLASLRATA